MKLFIHHGLAFVSAVLTYQQNTIALDRILLDTGSAGTLFSIDNVSSIGINMEADDELKRIRGVGGTKFVFTKQIDKLAVSELHITNFSVEIGAMDYGLNINGILGMDFLLQTRAIIDLDRLIVRQ